jgi:hypothetical protein
MQPHDFPTCNRGSFFLFIDRNKIRPRPRLILTFRTPRWKNATFRLSMTGYSKYQAIPLYFETLKSTTVFANAHTEPCLEPRIPVHIPAVYLGDTHFNIALSFKCFILQIVFISWVCNSEKISKGTVLLIR